MHSTLIVDSSFTGADSILNVKKKNIIDPDSVNNKCFFFLQLDTL